MKYFIYIFILLHISAFGVAQSSVDIQKSNQSAENILSELQHAFAGYVSIDIQFKLSMEVPGADIENQKGRLIQQDEMYVVDLDKQAMYSDGTHNWVHFKENEEVQWTDAENDGSFNVFSLTMLLEKYADHFWAEVLNESLEDGSPIKQIEFKPKDKNSEYSKLRLTLSTKNEIKRIKFFNKDGSRYTLMVENLSVDKKFPAETFQFNSKLYPDVLIEDLRID